MTTAGFIWYEMVTIEGPFVDGYEVLGTVDFWTCGRVVFGKVAEYPLSYLLYLDE